MLNIGFVARAAIYENCPVVSPDHISSHTNHTFDIENAFPPENNDVLMTGEFAVKASRIHDNMVAGKKRLFHRS